MANETFVHCWYKNGNTKDLKCKKWLQNILQKRSELIHEKERKDSLYHSTEGSFSFHINEDNSLLACDMQINTVCENSKLALPELCDKRFPGVQCNNDTLKSNDALEVSGGKFLSKFHPTPKKLSKCTLQPKAEYKTKPRVLFTPQTTTLQEINNSEEITPLIECIPKPSNQTSATIIPINDELSPTKNKNTSLPLLKFKHLYVQKNGNSFGKLDETEELNNVITGSGMLPNVTLHNPKIEDISRDVMVNTKQKLFMGKRAKKFIYPNEISNKKFPSHIISENEPYISSNHSIPEQAVQSVSVNQLSSPSAVRQKCATFENKNISIANMSPKESNESGNPSDFCPLFKTALGNKISISDVSLKSVQKLWDECDSNELDVNKVNEKSLKKSINTKMVNTYDDHKTTHSFTVKSNIPSKNVTSLNSGSHLHKSVNIRNNLKTNEVFVGFHTAGSNKKINIDPQVLLNAKKLLEDDCDEEQLAKSDGKIIESTEDETSGRSKSPILNSQMSQNFNSKSISYKNYTKKYNGTNCNENYQDKCETVIENVSSSEQIMKGNHTQSNLTTETQDIISITEDFFLFSSCSADKYRQKRQADKDNSHIVKKFKG